MSPCPPVPLFPCSSIPLFPCPIPLPAPRLPPDSAHPTAVTFIFQINRFTFWGCKLISQRLTPPRGVPAPLLPLGGGPQEPPGAPGEVPEASCHWWLLGGRSLISGSGSLFWEGQVGCGGWVLPQVQPFPGCSILGGVGRGHAGDISVAAVAQCLGPICGEGGGRGDEGPSPPWPARAGEGLRGRVTRRISPGVRRGRGRGGPSHPRTARGFHTPRDSLGRRGGAGGEVPHPQGQPRGWGGGVGPRVRKVPRWGGGAGVGVSHPQGCPDGGQLEEDPPPLLGTDTSQVFRAHLQQLVPLQHPQSPHRAAGGGRGRGKPGLPPPPDGPTRVFWWGGGSRDHLHPREALVHQPGCHLCRRGVGLQAGGTVLERGAKGGDIGVAPGHPLLVGGRGEGRAETTPTCLALCPALCPGSGRGSRMLPGTCPLSPHSSCTSHHFFCWSRT